MHCVTPVLGWDSPRLQLGKGGRVVKVTGIEQQGRTATVRAWALCVVVRGYLRTALQLQVHTRCTALLGNLLLLLLPLPLLITACDPLCCATPHMARVHCTTAGAAARLQQAGPG